MNKNEKQKQNRLTKSDKKVILVQVLIIVFAISATLFLFLRLIPDSKIVDVKYTEFEKYVEDERVDTVTIDSDAGKIKFKLQGGSIVYRTSYPYSATFVENMLMHDIDVGYARKFNFSNLLNYALWGVIIFFGIVMYKSMSTSDKKDVVEIDSKTSTFKDVAGMTDIKEDMMSLVNLIKSGKYKKENIKIPKGILLQGPPGNGKTLLARAFAGECGMNFMAMNASDFGSPLVGVSGMKINAIFDKAKKKSPCVIFIDEIDSIGARRTRANNASDKEMNTILTVLLNQMDGFKQNEGIIVIGATNRAEDIDKALLRPGRFDRKFTIPNPDRETRKALFKLYTKKLKLADDVTAEEFVSITAGCSSATIEGLINEAHINATVNERDEISRDDLHNAYIRLSVDGVLKKKSRWEGDTLRSCSYHEAGHAVVAAVLGSTVREVTVIPTTANAGGLTMTDDGEDEFGSVEKALNQICQLYGGKVAEEMIYGSPDKISFGASSDIRRATMLATECVTAMDGIDYLVLGSNGEKKMSERVTAILLEQHNRCKKVLSANRERLDAVANELLSKNTLSEKEFKMVFEREVENADV